MVGGVLSTGTGLVCRYRDEFSRSLGHWRDSRQISVSGGDINAAPVSYAVDGRQFIAIMAGPRVRLRGTGEVSAGPAVLLTISANSCVCSSVGWSGMPRRLHVVSPANHPMAKASMACSLTQRAAPQRNRRACQAALHRFRCGTAGSIPRPNHSRQREKRSARASDLRGRGCRRSVIFG